MEVGAWIRRSYMLSAGCIVLQAKNGFVLLMQLGWPDDRCIFVVV
jgi:hypothetical protein